MHTVHASKTAQNQPNMEQNGGFHTETGQVQSRLVPKWSQNDAFHTYTRLYEHINPDVSACVLLNRSNSKFKMEQNDGFHTSIRANVRGGRTCVHSSIYTYSSGGAEGRAIDLHRDDLIDYLHNSSFEIKQFLVFNTQFLVLTTQFIIFFSPR